MSSDANNFLEQVVAQFETFAAPLADALSHSGGVYDLLAIRGWNLTALKTADLSAFAALVDTLQQSFMDLQAIQSFDDLSGVAKAIDDLGLALEQLQSIRNTLVAAAGIQLTTAQAEALAGDVLECLVFAYLRKRLPRSYEVLLTLTLVEIEYAQTLLDAAGDVLRYPIRRPALRLDNLGKLLTDPLAHLKSAYLPSSGLTDDAAAIAFATRLFGRLEAIVLALGGHAMAGLRDPLDSELTNPTNTAFPRSFTFAFLPPPVQLGGSGAALGSLLGSTLVVVPANGSASDNTPGPALEVVPFGLASFAVQFGSWAATLTTGGTSGPMVITGQGVRFSEPGASRLELGLDVSKGQEGSPALLLGSSSGTRLQIDMITFATSLQLASGDRDFGVLLDLHKAALILSAGEGDGFLQKVLPPDGLRTDFDLAIGWSSRNGLYFRGSLGLEATLPIRKNLLGILKIESVYLALQAKQTGINAVAALTVTLQIGPLTAAVEQMGLVASLSFPEDGGNLGPLDLGFGFKPPKGVALSINSGPVKGGGYLFFDPDQAMYAGAVQLSIKALSLSAVGVVTTRLPDGSDGFSMLVMITAEFPPIQLGFGFSLIGIGGLVGIHRGMEQDVLADRLREGRLGSILFPRDVVANVHTIIDDIRAVFPAQRDRYVFGPMVKVGWGANSLLEIDVAVLLSVPAPITIAILGRVRAALPTKDDPVIDLRLEVLGLIDLGRGRLTVEARLVDSRIAMFAVSGGMALLISWGATKAFVLSVGGFNRRFLPPPDFRAPPRLAIALSTGENPTFTLSSYFAITSNAIQFGAAADLHAQADTALGLFSVDAYAQFDVLLIFDPPFFAADLAAGVEIKRNGATLFLARLEASLTGPEPWRVAGVVEFQCIVPLRIPFEAIIGEPAQQAPAAGREFAQLAEQLAAEVVRADNWTALPKAETESVVTLRKVETVPGTVLVHPLGGLGFRQRLLPFEKVIRKFGTSTVIDPAKFVIERLDVGGAAVAKREVGEDFAPGEFDVLTEDEKLSRPAFETMTAGVEASPAGLWLPDSLLAPAGARFDETVINPTGPLPGPRPQSTQPGLGFTQARPGLQGNAVVLPAAIAVKPETYVFAERDTLTTHPGGEAGHAVLDDRRRQNDGGGANTVLVPAHEAVVVVEL